MDFEQDGIAAGQHTRLDSWKEIAAYLQRDVRTARRWELEEGLPVHRHPHKSRSSVYAYRSQIDSWRDGKRLTTTPTPTRAWWRPMSAGIAALLCLAMAGDGVRPASAAGREGPATRQVWAGPDVDGDGDGSVSPDGRYLSFTNWATGDLGIRDLTTGKSRLLTNSGGWAASGDYTGQSVISADGRQVAYHWYVEKENRDELRVLPLKGSASPRTLYTGGKGRTDEMMPLAWTPDSKAVLVTHHLADQTSQFALLALQDGTVRVVKSFAYSIGTPRVSFSPDARYVAYPDTPEGKKRSIFVISTDGTRDTAVVQGSANNYAPLWSPDGTRLLFFSDRTGSNGLWSVAVEDGKLKGMEQLVKADMGNILPMGISRNGSIFYTVPGGARQNIYATELQADGRSSKPPTLFAERFVNSNLGPELSADGQYLAFYSLRPGCACLVIRTLSTGEERDVPIKIGVGAVFGAGPMWFPDDRSVLIVSREAQKPGLTFYRMDVATGNPVLLHHVNNPLQGYQLSPDGKAIFYTERENSAPDKIGTDLMRFDLEARREDRLKTGDWFISVAVSPDSKQIAYLVSVRPGSESYVAVMPTAGGESRQVFRGPQWMDGSRYNTLSWSPDGRFVMFVRGSVADSGPNVVWRVSATGGQAEQVGISMRGRIKAAQVQPDGKRLFFAANEQNSSEVWVLENFLPKITSSR